MKKELRPQSGNTRCVATLLAIALLGSSTGFGQAAPAPSTAATPPPAAETPQKLEAFIVTGSYLPVAVEVNASPVVSIERADIGQSGTTDALRLLKQMTPVFTGNGNTGNEVDNGGYGESYVALRNLVTLVLVNGRRMANSPFRNRPC